VTKLINRTPLEIPSIPNHDRAHIVSIELANDAAEKYASEVGSYPAEDSLRSVESALSMRENLEYVSPSENRGDMRKADQQIMAASSNGEVLTNSYDIQRAVNQFESSKSISDADSDFGGFIKNDFVGKINAVNPITGNVNQIRTIARQQSTAAELGIRYNKDGSVHKGCSAARDGMRITNAGNVDGRSREGRALRGRR
jgi:hypothetical protein